MTQTSPGRVPGSCWASAIVELTTGSSWVTGSPRRAWSRLCFLRCIFHFLSFVGPTPETTQEAERLLPCSQVWGPSPSWRGWEPPREQAGLAFHPLYSGPACGHSVSLPAGTLSKGTGVRRAARGPRPPGPESTSCFTTRQANSSQRRLWPGWPAELPIFPSPLSAGQRTPRGQGSGLPRDLVETHSHCLGKAGQ